MAKRRRRRKTERRRPPELHIGPQYASRIPRSDSGPLDDYSLGDGTARRLPRRRDLFLFVLLFIIIGAVFVLALAPDLSDPGELLRLFLVLGRGIAIIAGTLGVLLALAYYYSAGIDWPRETVGRLVVIASIIGTAIAGAVLFLAYLEGRLGEVAPMARRALALLALVACLGLLLQRERR